MADMKILWADDEIELLKPHIIFLEQKGYKVTSVTNGDDAVEFTRKEPFDLIMLDENMPGKDGLTALSEIREFNPTIPIIMVTKNEEESLMEDAIGGKITDYLTKPVNPSQILLAIKKIFDSKKIAQEHLSRDYSREFMNISQRIQDDLDHEEWIKAYLKIIEWELELDKYPELGFQQTVQDLHREGNLTFSRYVERNYINWINSDNRPKLSVDVFPNWVFPWVEKGEKVVFILLDCLRTDQWLAMEPFLYDYYKVTKDYYFSILPTATPYSRNAIFSGYFPREIERKMPDLWQKGEEDEHSANRLEHRFLDELIKRKLPGKELVTRYVKIMDHDETLHTDKNLNSYLQADIFCMVLNFVDILAHKRSKSDILKEIAPNESAYRTLTNSWFEHSPLLSMLRTLSDMKVKVIISTDHGSIRGTRPTKVIGDRETSTSVRYKFGRNLKCNQKQVLQIKDPVAYKLPLRGINTQYLLAKEDFFLVYPTNYNQYVKILSDSFHHGGISLDEIVLPVITLEGLTR